MERDLMSQSFSKVYSDLLSTQAGDILVVVNPPAAWRLKEDHRWYSTRVSVSTEAMARGLSDYYGKKSEAIWWVY